MRTLILYDHFCPHHVACLALAVERFRERGDRLLPVEVYGSSATYGWQHDGSGRPMPSDCLFPADSLARPVHPLVEFGRTLRLIRQARVDVVVVNSWAMPSSWLIAFSRRAIGIRVVVVADSTEADRRRRAPLEHVKRFFLARVDAAFTAGIRQRRYLVQLGLGPDRIHDGCDAVDNDHFAAAISRRGARPSGGSIVIGTAARLVPDKNLEDALAAIGRIARTAAPPIRWRIAGRGPLEARLRERIDSLGAPVELVGFRDYSEMPEFYAGLDLYWQPSRCEPWGLALNEAMASGLPILCSDRCGAVEDLVSAENGWVHPIAAIEDLEAGLQQALEDRPRWNAMGQASSARIASWGPGRYAEGLHAAARTALERRD